MAPQVGLELFKQVKIIIYLLYCFECVKFLLALTNKKMATRFQVAKIMWIKQSLKYLYQEEADYCLTRREK